MTYPKISFGIIVLNGEPFTRYCLRQLYPFAHQIIVVEGASPAAARIATQEGHSNDGTLDVLYNFKHTEDPEGKLIIVTAENEGYPNGFWPGDKDEQSQAYAKRATGNYIWQVDIDEFYHPEDIKNIIAWILDNPSISGFSFYWKNFWGGFQYLADGWVYRDMLSKMKGIRRVFKWEKGYKYITHRPPTIFDSLGNDLCALSWIGPDETSSRGIYCYHYGMVFPHQAYTKMNYYSRLWSHCATMNEWIQTSFETLQKPFNIIHGTKPPSWLTRFHGKHPPQITNLTEDIQQNKIRIALRATEDLEKLLSKKKYSVITWMFDKSYPIVTSILSMLRSVQTIYESYRNLIFRLILRIRTIPLEQMQDVPDLFRAYRNLIKGSDLKRVSGGWIYQETFYPDYLTVGGASFAVQKKALTYCRGHGVDVGAGLWPLPGAIPIDINRGPGKNIIITDFSDNSLDYVFSSHCLEHIQQWQKALDIWLKKLKSCGILFLYLPHPDCAIWHPDSPFVRDGHKWIPQPEIICHYLQDHGCTILLAENEADAMQSFAICAKKGGDT